MQTRGFSVLIAIAAGMALSAVQAHNTAYLLDPDGNIFHKWEGYEGHVPETASVHLLENGLLLRQQAPGDWLELLGTQVGSYGIVQLLELEPNLEDGSTEIVWMWNSWDHIVQDVDPGKANYGIVHEEVGKHDINQRRITAEHLHMNSVDYHPESTWYAPFMSAAERLPNGNTLITNSHNMRIFEVTPDNEVVMDFVLEHLLAEELGHVGGRIWRTFKLPPDYPGLAGRL